MKKIATTTETTTTATTATTTETTVRIRRPYRVHLEKLSAYEVYIESHHWNGTATETHQWRIRLNATNRKEAEEFAFSKWKRLGVQGRVRKSLLMDIYPYSRYEYGYREFQCYIGSRYAVADMQADEDNWVYSRPYSPQTAEAKRNGKLSYKASDVLEWWEVTYDDFNSALASGTIHGFVSPFMFHHSVMESTEAYEAFREENPDVAEDYYGRQAETLWVFLYWLEEHYPEAVKKRLKECYNTECFLYECTL